MSRPLAYWSCGGDVVGPGGHALSLDDSWALYGLHLDEARAAAAASDRYTLDLALRRMRELSDAVGGARRWRMASAPVRLTAHPGVAR